MNTVENLRPVYIKGHIIQFLHKLFGEIGGHFTTDILKFDERQNHLILRVPKHSYVQLRAALTAINSFQGVQCCFYVNSVSTVLLSLLDA